jgi:hypothetical protein
MTTRQQLDQLIDELPAEAVHAVALSLEFVLIRQRLNVPDPVLQAFMDAPDDDEPVTAEDLAALAEARASLISDAGVPWTAYTYIGRNQLGR